MQIITIRDSKGQQLELVLENQSRINEYETKIKQFFQLPIKSEVILLDSEDTKVPLWTVVESYEKFNSKKFTLSKRGISTKISSSETISFGHQVSPLINSAVKQNNKLFFEFPDEIITKIEYNQIPSLIVDSFSTQKINVVVRMDNYFNEHFLNFIKAIDYSKISIETKFYYTNFIIYDKFFFLTNSCIVIYSGNIICEIGLDALTGEDVNLYFSQLISKLNLPLKSSNKNLLQLVQYSCQQGLLDEKEASQANEIEVQKLFPEEVKKILLSQDSLEKFSQKLRSYLRSLNSPNRGSPDLKGEEKILLKLKKTYRMKIINKNIYNILKRLAQRPEGQKKTKKHS